MTQYYAILNHAQERKTIVAVPEDEDSYRTHRYQTVDDDDIHDWRETANVEVRELDILGDAER
jgi:hypothetical protein